MQGKLLVYCNGEVEKIPELEEEVISAAHVLTWAGVATTDVISNNYIIKIRQNRS